MIDADQIMHEVIAEKVARDKIRRINDETLESGLYRVISGFGMPCDSCGFAFVIMPGQEIMLSKGSGLYNLTFPDSNIEMIISSAKVEQLIRQSVEKVEPFA